MDKGNLMRGVNVVTQIMGKDALLLVEDGQASACGSDLSVIVPVMDLELEERIVVEVGKIQRILKAIPDDEIEVSIDDNELVIEAENKRGGVDGISVFDDPFELKDNLESLEFDEWHDCPEGLVDALKNCADTTSESLGSFSLACVHITPEYVEATDNYRLYRAHIGMDGEYALLGSALKKIELINPTEYGTVEDMVAFRNDSGWTLFVRSNNIQYHDLSKALSLKDGRELVFPEGFSESVKRIHQAVQAMDRADVSISKGTVRVRGEHQGAWYEESRRVDFDGEDMEFAISPSIMANLLEKRSKARINEQKIRVDGDNEVYCVSLSSKGA